MRATFRKDGWARFPTDPLVLDWVAHALPAARCAVRDPTLAHWHQCEGTWFVGVDAMNNDAEGRIGTSGPLTGRAIDFVRAEFGDIPPLHKAQVSVVYPGYPQPRDGERAAGFRYRLNRDAAHVDGILAVGPDRRRKVREPHAFILGLPLNDVGVDAAPLVVWAGSHVIMREAFAKAFAGCGAADLRHIDITEVYQAARRQVFETCPRVLVPAKPGEAMLLHRLILHGVAPWPDTARAVPEGRIIAYFRPELPEGVVRWLAPD
ncbi:MAG: hypothetical protein ABJI96_03645 [Paracoccaceae bacterium]